MPTRDDIGAAPLALSEAYEAAHFDIPSLPVGKKIFCTVHLDQPRMLLKLDPEDQHNLEDRAAVRPVDNA